MRVRTNPTTGPPAITSRIEPPGCLRCHVHIRRPARAKRLRSKSVRVPGSHRVFFDGGVKRIEIRADNRARLPRARRIDRRPQRSLGKRSLERRELPKLSARHQRIDVFVRDVVERHVRRRLRPRNRGGEVRERQGKGHYARSITPKEKLPANRRSSLGAPCFGIGQTTTRRVVSTTEV